MNANSCINIKNCLRLKLYKRLKLFLARAGQMVAYHSPEIYLLPMYLMFQNLGKVFQPLELVHCLQCQKFRVRNKKAASAQYHQSSFGILISFALFQSPSS